MAGASTQRAAGGGAGQGAPLRTGFWLTAWVFVAVMLGTTLPTPLYVIYQGELHFSAGLVTLIFATYALGVLAALLWAGHVSDSWGRRPVMAVAVALSALSTIMFIVANSVGVLFVGRVLSGFAAGLVTGTATAALAELAPSGAGRLASRVATASNVGGLALGPLLAGLLAQYAMAPTLLVFYVYLGITVLAAAALAAVPETVSPRRAFSLGFRGLGVPEDGRGEFIAAAAAGFTAFSLLGLFSSLAPSFLRGVLQENSHAVAGAVVFSVFGVATVMQVAFAGYEDRRTVRTGIGLYFVALALILWGLSAHSLATFLVGAIATGSATGLMFMGSLATANRLAPQDRRGQVVSTYFLVSYVGLTIPVIGVGVASEHVGDFRATLVCSIVLAALAVFAALRVSRASHCAASRA